MKVLRSELPKHVTAWKGVGMGVGCILSFQTDSTNQIHLFSEMVTRLPGVFAWYFVRQYLVYCCCLNCHVEAGGIFLTFLQLVISNAPKNLCGAWQPTSPRMFPACWEMCFAAVMLNFVAKST